MTHLTTDADAFRIADELDETGVVCLENAVPAEWLAQARDAVLDHLSKYGEHDHFIRSPGGEEHASAADFIVCPDVTGLLTNVLRARFAEGAADAELTGTALRIIAGPQGEGDAWWFHYDASVITMIVPLFIPDKGRGNSGELVGFFNKRPFRRFVISNIVDKVVAQSGFYRQRILRRAGTPDYGRVVDMTVGNVYLLWGYRSLHANMPCAPGALRATLLLHFGRPHTGSKALSTAVRVQQMLRGGEVAEANTRQAVGQAPV